MPIEHVLNTYRFNLMLARKLVGDVTEQRMTSQPMPEMNHAAWVLGHLTMPRLWMKDILKLKSEVPSDWVEKFNTGSTPVTERIYPLKDELVAALTETHEEIDAAFRRM